jgi:glycosyltransferase involved in cell wall biosynthesis
MRIALMAPPWYSVPPRAYGGVELLVAGLADGLVARGHQVLLVSAGAQGTLAQGFRTLDAARPDLLGDEVTSLLHASIGEDALRDFDPDLVSDHTLPGLAAAEHRACPTVATIHGPLTGAYARLVRRSDGAELVAISEAQRRSAPDISWRATVPNGIPVRSYPFSQRKDDYLFFLGRMHPDKGVRQAIEVAERSGTRLVIAARIHGREEEDYFDTVVRPRLSSTIEFVGEVGFADKVRLLGSARALLFPLQWDEPYGLVVAEAQACGTPVLTLRRGAMPELVQHGRTGWLRDHHLELVDDVERLETLSPRTCRTHALDSLDIGLTVRGYEGVFATTVASGAGRASRIPTVVPPRPRGRTPVPDVRTASVDLTLRVPQLIPEENS